MAQGDLEVRVAADTSGLQAGMVQAAVVTEAQMKRIAQYVKAANDQASAIGRASQKSAGEVQSAYSSIAANADHVRSAHAGVNRELLVLAHELSQGNFSRFGGSMLVLAERTNALEYAMTASGAAILGATAAGVAFVALAAMGAIEADKFAKSLQLTGNYAALTQDSLEQLAQAQAKQTGQSLAGARASIEAAAGTGAFGPESIAAASRAMGDFQKITGATAEDAVAKFKTIGDGVAKWAQEQNRQIHFLTLGEFDYVKSLEETGQKEQAAREVLNALAQTLESRATPAVGALAATWKFLKQAVEDAGQALADVGKPDTLGDHMKDVERQIKWLQSGNAGGSYEQRQRDLIPLQAELARLTQEQAKQMAHLAEASRQAQIAQKGIDAQNAAEEWVKRGKAVSAYNDALEKFHANVKAAADAGKPFSPLDVKTGEKAIKDSFTDRGATAAANQYRDITATIKAFNDTTEEEFGHLAKLTEGQRLVIQVQERLATSAASLTEAQKQAKRADAARAATMRDLADASIAFRKALDTDAEQTIKQNAAAFEAQTKAMDAFRRSGASRVADIDFQTSLVGKSADEAARMQAMHAIQVAANNALEASSGKALNEILAEQAKQRDDVTAAMLRLKAAQDSVTSSFSKGWSGAMDDFSKKVADDAASAKKVFDDMAAGMTDAITQFAMTGKFNFKSLADSIIQDLIRIEAQKGVAWLLNAGTNAWGGGDSGGGVASLVSIGMGVASAAGFANGIDYVPYDGMLATLHEGERVISRQDAAVERNGRGGPSVVIHLGGMNIGSGVDAAGVAQAVRTGMAQAKAEMYRELNTGTRR